MIYLLKTYSSNKIKDMKLMSPEHIEVHIFDSDNICLIIAIKHDDDQREHQDCFVSQNFVRYWGHFGDQKLFYIFWHLNMGQHIINLQSWYSKILDIEGDFRM